MKKHYTDEERYEHCRKYRLSGKSQKKYAEENGINVRTFEDWCLAYKNIHGKFINVSKISEKENMIVEDRDLRVNILGEAEKVKKSTHFSRFDHSIVVIEYKGIKITTSLEQAEKLLENLYGNV